MAAFGIFDIILLFVSLAISLAIVIPFTGVLVRFRANFNPKGLRLDEEGSTAPPTGPVVRSYFAMFKRVYRIEVCFGWIAAPLFSDLMFLQGWPGLYKGISQANVLSVIPSSDKT